MNKINYNYLYFSQIYDSKARSLSLKEEPAIYAWYRTFDELYALSDPDDIADKILDFLSAKLSSKHKGRLGYLYELQVQESTNTLSEYKQQILRKLCKSEEERKSLIEIVCQSSNMQAPLYVGKALNLRKRIGEHCDGYSGLRERLEESGIEISSCIIKYKYLPDYSESNTDIGVDINEKSLLLEEIITKLSPAAFVNRPG